MIQFRPTALTHPITDDGKNILVIEPRSADGTMRVWIEKEGKQIHDSICQRQPSSFLLKQTAAAIFTGFFADREQSFFFTVITRRLFWDFLFVIAPEYLGRFVSDRDCRTFYLTSCPVIIQEELDGDIGKALVNVLHWRHEAGMWPRIVGPLIANAGGMRDALAAAFFGGPTVLEQFVAQQIK